MAQGDSCSPLDDPLTVSMPVGGAHEETTNSPYFDRGESDVFILAGVEDLMPASVALLRLSRSPLDDLQVMTDHALHLRRAARHG